jgi:beta-N-acetylhexosaminidase
MKPGTISRRDLLRLLALECISLGPMAGCGWFAKNLEVGEAPLTDTTTPAVPSTRGQQSLPAVATPSSFSPPAHESEAPPTATTVPKPASVSLDAKIGQMLLVGFRGLAVDEGHFIVRDIRERHLGGVVLFDFDVPTQQPERNVRSRTQLAALSQALQSAATAPLLVSIDHEGGKVTRLKEASGFPASLSHGQLGRLNDLEATFAQAAQMAETLADLGINLNLAPVVDLCANPDNPIIAKYDRCFSPDPAVVSDHAEQFIHAHHQHGVLCAAKHFPGHGSSRDDSHLGWVDVTATWSREELIPYQRLIAAGLADAVMTAHVYHAGLDPEDPATLSRAVLTGLLRGELGYDGVIVSDDLQMGAIAGYYGFEATIRKAIEAGVDLLTFANNSVYEPEVAAQAIAAIKQLVSAGVVTEERIDASYRRIQRMKSRLLT